MTSWLSSLDRGDRPLEILELFAGQARITRLARQLGIPAEAHDWDYDEEAIGKGGGLNNAMDITGPSGLVNLAYQIVMFWNGGSIVVKWLSFFPMINFQCFQKINDLEVGWSAHRPPKACDFSDSSLQVRGPHSHHWPLMFELGCHKCWNKPKRSTFTTGGPKCP